MQIDLIPYMYELLTLSLRHILIFFLTVSVSFTAMKVFHQVISERISIKLRIDNGGRHETLNLLHVSRCEMLHFVMSYMKQNKSRKQTLKSAQSGLEISFNLYSTALTENKP